MPLVTVAHTAVAVASVCGATKAAGTATLKSMTVNFMRVGAGEAAAEGTAMPVDRGNGSVDRGNGPVGDPVRVSLLSTTFLSSSRRPPLPLTLAPAVWASPPLDNPDSVALSKPTALPLPAAPPDPSADEDDDEEAFKLTVDEVAAMSSALSTFPTPTPGVLG